MMQHFTNSRSWFFALLAALPFATVSLGQSQDSVQEKKLNSAFQIQGEYVGRIVAPGFPQRSGMQIVATGLDTFDAYLLDGGLPGEGGVYLNRKRFVGKGVDNVTFTHPDVPLKILRMDQYPGMLFAYSDGNRIGSFRRVQRQSPTLNLPPPSDAIVIYQNPDNHRLKNATFNPDGTLNIGPETLDQITNARIHVEFKTPFTPTMSGQKRGNSGVYIQRRYEVQILDSFGLELQPNHCGGLYRQKNPDLNMAFPPQSWQTYDIYFYAAKFDEQGKRIQKARITVLHNGVKIHDNYELVNKTGAGRKESPTPGPIWFQNHGDRVLYRNLWMKPLSDKEILPSDLELLGLERENGKEGSSDSGCCPCQCETGHRCSGIGFGCLPRISSRCLSLGLFNRCVTRQPFGTCQKSCGLHSSATHSSLRFQHSCQHGLVRFR